MITVLLRVLTIAGTCTLAALLTRKILEKRAERESAESNAESSNKGANLSLVQRDKPAVPQGSASAAANAPASKPAAPSPARPAPAAETKPKVEEKPEAKAAESKSDAADELSRKREEMQSSGRNQAERQEKVAKSKEAAMAAQKAVAAKRRGQNNTGDFSVPKDEEASAPKTVEAPAPKPSATPAAAPVNAAQEKAKVVISSSKQILQTYKQPEGVKVDLSLANFSIDTAERLYAQEKFDEAWEKASSVGLLIGMSEMRASIEAQLKTMKADPEKAEKVKQIRNVLNEADKFLSDANQSFVSEESGKGDFLKQLQNAFQKTMQAQNELMA